MKPPEPGPYTARSWLKVVGCGTGSASFSEGPIFQKEEFEKPKALVHEVITIDRDFQTRAHEHLQAAMFGKFLGKVLPLD